MKTYAKYVFTPLLGLLLLMPECFAQDDPAPAFLQPELDQILAPIALYPDSLLSQILMASTYPLEIVEAAPWSRANPGFEGEAAVRGVDDRDWDPSVKSLVAFPKILTMMDDKLEWTQRLGEAFLAQPEQVMDTVQSLRQTAYAAGNLKSNVHYRVEQQDGTIAIQSPYPEVIYLPYYDPLDVYGRWRWPAHPPVYWAPWPGYYAYPGFVGFRWSSAVFIGPRFFFGACDWRLRHVTVVNVRPFHDHRADRRPLPARHVWKRDPGHRRGVAYRHPSTQSEIARTVKAPAVHRGIYVRGPSTRAPHFETSHGSRPDSGKQPFASSHNVESRPDDRRGPPRRGSFRSTSNTDVKRDRRRMPMAHTGSDDSKLKTSNVHRTFEREPTARRDEDRGNHARGSVKGGGFPAHGPSHGTGSFSMSQGSKKDFSSGSAARGNFSERRWSRGIESAPVPSFSSKKSFKGESSGGSRSLNGSHDLNGGGGYNFRRR